MSRTGSRRGWWLGAAALVASGIGCQRRDEPRPTPAAQPRVALSPQAAAGEASFKKYCALCHGADARGYAADNAPSLVSETFLASASDTYLSRSIREGRPGTAMAGYAKQYGGPLDDAEVTSIIAFLRSRSSSGPVTLAAAAHAGDAERGKEVYARECVKCHGTRESRGFAPQLWNPTFLSTANDDFVRYAVQMGRPGTAMPSFIAQLSPGDVDDVVAHVRSWGAPPPTRPNAAQHPEIPKGPVLINPQGKQASFALRENRYVPAAEVKKALEAKKRLVIIDARATSDWLMVRIPGSISVPYYGFERLNDVPKDDTWVIAYCACPHHASGVVVDELRKRGYQHTAVLDEGILEWQKRGYPIEGTSSTPPAVSGSAAPIKAPPTPRR